MFRNVMDVVVAATPGFEVVGRASSGREALHLVEELAPHLVLLDLHMPDMRDPCRIAVSPRAKAAPT